MGIPAPSPSSSPADACTEPIALIDGRTDVLGSVTLSNHGRKRFRGLVADVALEQLQQSEAETDLARIRTLIGNAQSTLIELHQLAGQACEEGR